MKQTVRQSAASNLHLQRWQASSTTLLQQKISST